MCLWRGPLITFDCFRYLSQEAKRVTTKIAISFNRLSHRADSLGSRACSASIRRRDDVAQLNLRGEARLGPKVSAKVISLALMPHQQRKLRALRLINKRVDSLAWLLSELRSGLGCSSQVGSPQLQLGISLSFFFIIIVSLQVVLYFAALPTNPPVLLTGCAKTDSSRLSAEPLAFIQTLSASSLRSAEPLVSTERL